jgi:hypothetical protein
MTYEVRIETVPAQHLLVVRERIRREDLARAIMRNSRSRPA